MASAFVRQFRSTIFSRTSYELVEWQSRREKRNEIETEANCHHRVWHDRVLICILFLALRDISLQDAARTIRRHDAKARTRYHSSIFKSLCYVRWEVKVYRRITRAIFKKFIFRPAILSGRLLLREHWDKIEAFTGTDIKRNQNNSNLIK